MTNKKKPGKGIFSANGGFTFIEIMIVVFLMSLVVGITTVFFAGTLPSAKLKASARELSSTIKYTKQLALATNEKQVLIIDLNGGSYGIKGHKVRNIASSTVLTVYEANPNSRPILAGQYTISYDATGASDWDRITLGRNEKIITISADPIRTAVIGDWKKK
jgi:prepilin-type N-terminal cleavage/methylation domain-containing protein